MLLHLAEQSNSFLIFEVYREIASQAMEEHFLQGDEEKRLGIPVGPLNDRSKVTLAGSQFGFINLFMAPFTLGIIHIFPMIYPEVERLVVNLKEWSEIMKSEGDKSADQNDSKIEKIETQFARFVKGAEANAGTASKAAERPVNAADSILGPSNTVDLAGHWTCVNTFGLEEFLKSTGVSWARRKAAMGAPWPSWEFQQSGDHIVFINNSAVGVLREEITANNSPFTIVDGWKQKVECIAFWENKSLVIEKQGPQGKFREERCIDASGKLQFSLQPVEPQGPKWGRTFERGKKK
jgi:hypothetical protein